MLIGIIRNLLLDNRRRRIAVSLFWVALISVFQFGYTNCSVQKPGLASTGYASAAFIHTGLENSCNGCHNAQRPLTTAGWVSPAYVNSPFDYGSHGIVNNVAMDCFQCHQGMANSVRTRADWANGSYHGNMGNANSGLKACISCHSTQAASGVAFANSYNSGNTTSINQYLSAYNPSSTPATIPTHVTSGECITCHTGVTSAGSFQSLTDWLKGKPVSYQAGLAPASTPVPLVTLGSYVQYVPTVNGSNVVVGITANTITFPETMNHSAAIMNTAYLGNTAQTVVAQCTTCHTGTSFNPGYFHKNIASMTSTALSTCSECHSGTDPYLSTDGNMPMGSVAAPAFAGTLPNTTPSLFVAGPMPQMTHQTSSIATSFNSVTGATTSTPDCATCHLASAQTSGFGISGWAGASFHANVATLPAGTRCDSCHANNRIGISALALAGTAAATPSATTTAQNTYVTWTPSATTTFKTAASTGHANGLDCVTCHAAPTAGNDSLTSIAGWTVGGTTSYNHKTNNPSTCVNCHAYPGLVGGYDHSTTTADCNTCHTISFPPALGMVMGAWYPGNKVPVGGVGNAALNFGFGNAYNPTYTFNSATVPPTTNLTTNGTLVSGAQIDGYFNHQSIELNSTYMTNTNNCTACHTVNGSTCYSATASCKVYFHSNISKISGLLSNGGTSPSTCNSCHLNSGTTAAPPGFPMAYTNNGVTLNAVVTGPAATYTTDKTPNMSHAYYLSSNGDAVSGGTVTGTPLDCNACHANLLNASTGNYPVSSGTTPTATVWANGNFHGATGLGAVTNCSGCHIMRMPASDQQATLTYNAGTSVICSPTAASQPACKTPGTGLIPFVGNSNYVFSTHTTTAGSLIEHMNHLAPVFISTNQGLAPTTATTPQTMDCYICHGNTNAGTAGAWAKGNFHTSLKNKGYAQPTQCLTCHVGDVPNLTSVAANLFDHTTNTQECNGCHNQSSAYLAGTATPTLPSNLWYPASSSHAATGTTAGSTLKCESCHGGTGSGLSPQMSLCSQTTSGGGPCSLAYSDSVALNPKNMKKNWGTTAVSGTATVYPNHFWDGYSASTATSSYCITCHTDFSSFGFNQPVTGTPSLKYAHTLSGGGGGGGGGGKTNNVSPVVLNGVSYSAGYCINCHYFDAAGKYTTLTNYYNGSTPYISFDTSAGTFSVAGSGTTSTPLALLTSTNVVTGMTTIHNQANTASTVVHGPMGNSASGGTKSSITSYDCSSCHQYQSHTSGKTTEWAGNHTSTVYGQNTGNVPNDNNNGCVTCHGQGSSP